MDILFLEESCDCDAFRCDSTVEGEDKFDFEEEEGEEKEKEEEEA